MKRILPTHIALLAVGGVLLTMACSSKPQPVAAPEAKPVAATTPPVAVPAPPVQAAVEPPLRTRIDVDVEEMNRTGYLKDAFFDYNRYEIRADQRDMLEKNAAWLKGHPTVNITVAGHCDERGTAQYNMALGQQRAEAVRSYLVQLGVDASRIQIISYGNERPFAIGHDEEAWAQNRRDHFLVTAS
jgi:peptidoglycan-associated lipoprotein